MVIVHNLGEISRVAGTEEHLSDMMESLYIAEVRNDCRMDSKLDIYICTQVLD